MRMLTENTNVRIGADQSPTVDLTPSQRRLFDIRNYLQQAGESGKSDLDILRDAQAYGVTPQDLARALGADDVAPVQARYDRALAVQNYVDQNPNANPLDVLRVAQESGFSPEDIRNVSGMTTEEILRANMPESEDDPRTEAIRNIVKDTVNNKAIQALLLTNPYTAPIAPFVPAFKPVKKLFSQIGSWF